MSIDNRAWIVTDLSYGDQGKGETVQSIACRYPVHTVVRHHGGAQAGHNVFSPEGLYHGFSQFGSASLLPKVATHLSQYTVLSPWKMVKEAQVLIEKGVTDIWQRTTISADALVITPFHRAANRLREIARGNSRHGSCGLGVGETVSDSLELPAALVLRIGDLTDAQRLREMLLAIQRHKHDSLATAGVIDQAKRYEQSAELLADLTNPAAVDDYISLLQPFLAKAQIVPSDYFAEILQQDGHIVFEGAQGVLLDEWRGFHPYTTWSTCTPHNAWHMLEQYDFDGQVTSLGLLRAYATRHGPGPFVSQDDALSQYIVDPHNQFNDWQRSFRLGWFDAVAARYAIAACEGRMDGLVISCLDQLQQLAQWYFCDYYNTSFTARIGPREDCFERDNNARVTDITLGPYKDLGYQAELTRQLFWQEPHMALATAASSHPQRVEEFLAVIEQHVDRSVYLTSEGVGPAAKKWRINIAA